MMMADNRCAHTPLHLAYSFHHIPPKYVPNPSPPPSLTPLPFPPFFDNVHELVTLRRRHLQSKSQSQKRRTRANRGKVASELEHSRRLPSSRRGGLTKEPRLHACNTCTDTQCDTAPFRLILSKPCINVQFWPLLTSYTLRIGLGGHRVARSRRANKAAERVASGG
jgi:hypothetical protein